MPTGYVVDVMANIQKVPTTSINTFGPLCQKFTEMVSAQCKTAKCIDFVFDCYIAGSVKNNERKRRKSQIPIVLSDIANDNQLPKDMDSFWPSADNKIKLEILLRNWLKDYYTHQNIKGLKIVFNQVVGANLSVSSEFLSDGKLSEILCFNSGLEEAYLQIIPHCLYSVKSGLIRLVILSEDTDVFVESMYFSNHFKSLGLIERSGPERVTK